jgi:uncharacterized membrane protein YphA (DoxX/SURF4 family)
MKLMQEMRDWKNWVTLVARLVLGVVFLWAGISKVGNLPGFVQATAAYQIGPYWMAQIIGTGLPFAEIGLGLMLIAGLFTRVGGLLSGLLMVAFIIGIASVWIRGISIDCGCFGDGGPITPEEAAKAYPWELARDVGMLALSVWLVVIKQPFLAIDNWLFRPIEEVVARADAARQGANRRKR